MCEQASSFCGGWGINREALVRAVASLGASALNFFDPQLRVPLIGCFPQPTSSTVTLDSPDSIEGMKIQPPINAEQL